MQAREPGTPPLGQLLVERGVLTSTQLYQISLEEQVTGKALGEIIIERGLASAETLRDASGDGGLPDGTETGSGEDADWRRRLLEVADGNDKDSDEQKDTPEGRPRGLRARAARRLDEYLTATAAELDERGETLRSRSMALDEEAARLSTVESALAERARGLGELDIADEDAARQIDQLLQVVAALGAKIDEVTQERDDARREVTLAREKLVVSATESAARERLLEESDERAIALSTSLEAARAELEAAAADTARRNEIAAKLQQELATQASDLANARRTLEEQAGRVSALERSVREKQATLSAAEHQLRELRAENAELKTSHEQVEALLANRDRFVRDLAGRLDDELSRVAREQAAETFGGTPARHPYSQSND